MSSSGKKGREKELTSDHFNNAAHAINREEKQASRLGKKSLSGGGRREKGGQ